MNFFNRSGGDQEKFFSEEEVSLDLLVRDRRLVPTRRHEETEIHGVLAFLRGQRQFLGGQSIDVVGRNAAHIARRRSRNTRATAFWLLYSGIFFSQRADGATSMWCSAPPC
jgi:hypothetical protein